MTSDEAQKRTRRSFLTAAAGVTAGFFAIPYLRSKGQDAFYLNGELRQKLQTERLAQLYPRDQAVFPPVNGDIGLAEMVHSWALQVNHPGRTQSYTLEQIRQLPRHEFTTQLRCVEGWSRIATWAGASLADVAGQVPADCIYVGGVTPDGAYYVGLDLASALHPQTLLCYEMNGEPLKSEHGAPLRLVVPLKYGFKWLKRLGSLSFTAVKPPDYWAEQGYDWDSGL